MNTLTQGQLRDNLRTIQGWFEDESESSGHGHLVVTVLILTWKVLVLFWLFLILTLTVPVPIWTTIGSFWAFPVQSEVSAVLVGFLTSYGLVWLQPRLWPRYLYNFERFITKVVCPLLFLKGSLSGLGILGWLEFGLHLVYVGVATVGYFGLVRYRIIGSIPLHPICPTPESLNPLVIGVVSHCIFLVDLVFPGSGTTTPWPLFIWDRTILFCWMAISKPSFPTFVCGYPHFCLL